MSSPAVQALVAEEDGHSERVATDKEYWGKYQREVLRPALDAIERFAMPVVTGLPRIYSRRIVRHLSCQVLISIWDDEGVQHFVRVMRQRADSPDTTYGDFERLVKWLRAHPL